MTIKRFVALAAVVTGVVLASSTAGAQSILREHERHTHFEIEVHGIYPFDGWSGGALGFGGGAQVGFSVLPEGFGEHLNNSLAVVAGGDFIWWFNTYDAYPELSVHAAAQWNVYLTERFSVFAEAGIAFGFYFHTRGCAGQCGIFYPWPDLGVGGRLHFAGRNGFPSLTFRVGTLGITVGVSF